jgi:DNA-binding Lrp family transcriptional regulator
MITGAMDALDLSILRELEADARQPLSEVAKKLGISRHLAGRRLHSLQDRKLVTFLAFTNPRALGYRTLAITGVRVSPGSLHPVSDRLSALPNVLLVVTTSGRNDIVIWSMLADPTDLTTFLTRELGSIPGILSNETMIVLDWWVCRSFLSSPRWEMMSFSPELRPADPPCKEHGLPQDPKQERPGFRVDRTDLAMLKEIEQAPKQSISTLARKAGISRPNATARLDRLLNEEITRVVAFVTPFRIGYATAAIIGMRALPNSTGPVLEMVRSLPSVHWVASVVGRYDLIALVTWPNAIALSRFLGTQLGVIPGITDIETIICMDTRKMSFAYVATSSLAMIGAR